MKLLNQDSQFWLIASLFIACYFGVISLFHAFGQPYIVQDDARHHIIWLQQFIDPELFTNDLISDYFQSVAPLGYKTFYWLDAKLGISPIVLAKIVPTFLALITTFYLFRFFLKILPIPFGAFLATLILNINIWMKDDLVSGSPRAFVYPIFAAFLYYLVKRSLIPVLITIALQGLFFPQLVFVQIILLTIRALDQKENKTKYLFVFLGLVTALIVLLPFALHVSEFGSAISAEQMKISPEFRFNGRIEYFDYPPLLFPFMSSSGFGAPIFPPFIWLSLGLPFVLKSSSFVKRFMTEDTKILRQLLLASLLMFLLAHLLTLHLYFPGRYTYHSLRFIMVISSAIVILAILDYIQKRFNYKLTKSVINFVFVLLLIPGFTPALFLPFQEWRTGTNSEIYQFFASKPKDILIASLTSDTSNIPAFAQRSVLFSSEFALPIHPIYYQQMKQRAINLIEAQYSSDLSDTQNFIQKYSIDYLMLEPASFTSDYLLKTKWLINSSFKEMIFQVSEQLKNGQIPALAKVIDRCSVKKTERLNVLDSECIINSSTTNFSK